MKKIKILIAVLLSLCLAFAVTGCSGDNLKDSVINGFNDMLQHFSKYALTDEKDLQGDKTKGEDTYTGSYTADYEDFNDKEYIFGGTALERDKGSELTVTYELTVDSGTARLYWLDKGEEKVIADTSKNGTYFGMFDKPLIHSCSDKAELDLIRHLLCHCRHFTRHLICHSVLSH